jgi:hypothetical protein
LIRRADTLAWLSADVELRHADLASGAVPHDVTRALFTHEVEARVNFADIENGVDQTAGVLAKQLEADRATFLGLLDADLATVAANPGSLPVDVAVAYRLMSLDAYLGIAAIAGVQHLVDQSEATYRDQLAEAATTGGQRVLDEAAQMGVDTTSLRTKLGGLDEYRLDLAARRLAQAPHADVLAAAADEAYRLPGLARGQLQPTIMDGLRRLSPTPLLTTIARPAVQAADGIARTAAMSLLPVAKGYYASELLDKATCDPCSIIDGTQYDTLAQAKADYPNGGYKDCLGGDRCRGTIVAVWGSEQPHGV